MTMQLRDAGEPFYTFSQIHTDFYKRLQTDPRLTSEYRIDSWDEGRFNAYHFPSTGIHGRYNRISVELTDETTGMYSYKVTVIVWVLINHHNVSQQAFLGELYLGRVNQIFTERPDDWSLDGSVSDIQFIRADYLHDWTQAGQSVLLCSARFEIIVDVERAHTQS